MSQTMHATQLLVTITLGHSTIVTTEMQGKGLQHARLTLVSLLHDSGNVPPSRFSRRAKEVNCSGNNSLGRADSHFITNTRCRCQLVIIDQQLNSLS